MAKNVTPQIMDMSKQGFSVRDIADTLKVDRQKVEDVIAKYSPEPIPRNKEAVFGLNITNTYLDEVEEDLEKVEEDLEKAEVMVDKNPKNKTLRDHLDDLIKKQEELEELEEKLQKEREDLDKRKDHLPEREEAYNAYQQRMFKEKTVARYQYLLDELLNDSTNSRWKGIEVDAYLEQLEALRERLTLFCNYNRIDERRLVIYAGLRYLINLVEGIQKKQTKGLFSGTSVLFNLNEETRDQIKAFTTDSFEKEIETPVAVNPFANLL